MEMSIHPNNRIAMMVKFLFFFFDRSNDRMALMMNWRYLDFSVSILLRDDPCCVELWALKLLAVIIGAKTAEDLVNLGLVYFYTAYDVYESKVCSVNHAPV